MFDVIVVGSGYSGAVVAARLAATSRVLLVERGRRWRTGEFPTTLSGIARAYYSRRRPLGLWAMRLGDGTGNVFVSAYGGASLVNYGITARPDDHVFDEWPLTVAELEPYFARASEMLAAEPNPLADELGDKAFLDRLEPGRRVDLVNTIDWSRCTQCGRCVPGCNENAKRSLDTTYLALAERDGAHVLTETEALSCTPREDGGWDVVLAPTIGGAFNRVSTRQLVLAGGTFGTLDFLQRNRAVLPTTPALGQRMSMNGDSLAFLYNTQAEISGHHGAPISTSVRLPFIDAEGRVRTLTIMSGRIPAVAMRASGALLALLVGVVPGQPRETGRGVDDRWRRRVMRRFRDVMRTGPDGALSRTFMYKLDAQDSARGVARFDEHGCAAIDWPDYASDPILRFAGQRLEHWARQVGGSVVHQLGTWPGMRSFSVHPLGGCRMAPSPESGVVDPHYRVYRHDGAVYPGLRIVDASIFPGSLGVPPSLTVAALAERAADELKAELANARSGVAAGG